MIKQVDINDAESYIESHFKVITKADAQGRSTLAPMQLWKAQKYWLTNRTHRDIILKARQMGLSTAVMAANAHAVFTQPYQRMSIVTHNQDTSEFLLQTVQRFYRNLPDAIRPVTDWASGARMRFPKFDSYIFIDSAESKAVGIGHTLNRVHLSEVSRWPEQRAYELYAGMSQTVPEGGFITIESTPRGRRGLFYGLYDAAKRGDINYTTFFFPWWWDESYKRPVTKKMEFNAEEQSLIDNGLIPEQIAFRREKIAELGELFFQEYPENDIDCWLSTEMSVIDGISLRKYFSQIKPGRDEGNLTIWKDYIGGHKYVIGVDVASGMVKGDYSVAAVLDVRNCEYVARLRGRIHPDLFAEQVYNLGIRYNIAQIGVERAGHGHTVLRILLEKNYPNLYHHQDYDDIMKDFSDEPGWKTNVKTKPIMVDGIIIAFRSGDLITYSENLLDEASKLVWEGGKIKKPGGGFDDEFDAACIALQMREIAPLTEASIHPTVTQYARISL